MNKSVSRAVIPVLTAMVALGPVSTDLYLPSLPSIGSFFSASVSQTQLTLSVFMLGFAGGTLIYGPMSDRFGRRPLILAGLVLFAVSSIGCALAGSIEQLLALRLVQGIGSAAGVVLSRAVVRDLFAREEAARILSYMSGVMALAPALAPILGGWIHLGFGWRGQFAALTIMGVALLTAAKVLVVETNSSLNAQATRPATLVRNVARLLSHGGFIGYALTTGLSYGGLFSFISGGAFVVIGVLGVAPENFGYLFIFVAGGFVSGALIGGRLTKRLGIHAMMRAGVWIGLGAGLLGLGLAVAGVQTLPAVIGPVALVFFSCALVFPNAMAGAIAPFPDMAGTASSVASFLQMTVGALIGVAVGVLHDGTTVPLFAVIACSTLGALGVFYTVIRRGAGA
ncbi:MAG: Bcr/CflA family multidrug efflux MFS transporter [Rhodospirillaceae bacterium]|nr:Bcr/CflA family multidrug efflux MFS transporter [Rhodospirillaceae bacterium]